MFHAAHAGSHQLSPTFFHFLCSGTVQVLVEILDDLSLGEYEVKLNHRRLLDAMLDIAGVVSALGGLLHSTASRQALPGHPLQRIPCKAPLASLRLPRLAGLVCRLRMKL